MTNPLLPQSSPLYGVGVSNITPFTYRDGLTYLKRLELMDKYIKRVLIPWVQGNYNDIVEAVVGNAVELQDEVMAQILADIESETRIFLNNLLAQVITEKPDDEGVFTIMDFNPSDDNDYGTPDPDNPGFWLD